jgi:NhaA family Na+:H+ antiporter
VRSFWPYALIGGTLSWFGLYMTGVHAALAFVPVVPFMPHAERDAGLFAESEPHDDTMNRFEHFFKPFVDTGLIFFGLANAGVLLNAESLTGTATWSIFLALLVGKTFGIWLFTLAGTKAGLDLPEHMDMKVMTVVGCVAGIGFTVALFVVSVAYDAAAAGDDLLAVIDMLKLGALLSFAAGPIAAIMARVMGIEKLEGEPPDPHAHH